MKNLVKIVSFSKKVTLQIVALLLSVIICTLTIGNSFMCTKSISRVYAAEVIGTLAGDAVWELILGLLASTGLTAAAIENKDALIAQYKSQLDAEIATDEYIIDSAIELYDTTTGVIQSIPFDEISLALENYHDTVVDDLTGIYAKYCPALLDSTNSFVSSVVNKDIIIDGLTEIIDSCATSSDVINQWSGETYNYNVAVRVEYDYTNPNTNVTQHIIETYNVDSTYDSPICASYLTDEPTYLSDGSCVIYKRLNFYRQYNGTSWKVHNIYGNHIKSVDGIVSEGTFSSRNSILIGEWYNTSSYNHNVQMSFSTNIPVFSSFIDVENYLAGTGAVTGALNYSTDITDGITDNNDLPTIGNFANEIWARIAEAVDVGIGSYGAGVGVGVNDWADDISFVGLGALSDYANGIQDVFDRTIDDIISGAFDPALDIPRTYDDAWIHAVDRTWDDVIENDIDKPVENEVDTPIDVVIENPVGNDDNDDNNDDDETIDDGEVVPKTVSTLGDISGNLKYKFPFCIPWDLRYMLLALADTPQTPIFRLPIVVERYNIHEDIVIDMTPFEGLSKLSRTFLTLIFIYGLINWTVKIVSVRKEE